jgi:hypothetical protein
MTVRREWGDGPYSPEIRTQKLQHLQEVDRAVVGDWSVAKACEGSFDEGEDVLLEISGHIGPRPRDIVLLSDIETCEGTDSLDKTAQTRQRPARLCPHTCNGRLTDFGIFAA